MRLDSLFLWYLGDALRPRYVGALNLVQAGKGVSLRYGKDWLLSGFALSEDMPLVDTEFMPPGRFLADAPRAAGAVDDARPDRWGEKVIRFIERPQRLSLMEYLYFAGDDRFGALGVSVSDQTYQPHGKGPLPRLEDVQSLSEVAAKIEAAEPLSNTEARMMSRGGSPLGGAKPKALIAIDGVQWLVKFYNGESVDTPLVEHATMTLAQQAGITVAQTQLLSLAGMHALAVRRFDRGLAGERLHCISAATAIRAATATGQAPMMAYSELARILRRVGVARDGVYARDAHELFRRMVFNILMDNTDDHEKNHSLLVQDVFKQPRLKLAPAYDVLPSNSGQGYQEFICGERDRESSLENALSHCAAFGLTRDQAASHIRSVVAVVNQWQRHFREQGVSCGDIESIAQQIDGPFLGEQRKAFAETV